MLERGTMSRRGFLQKSLAGMAAAGLPAWYAQETLAAQQANQPAKAVDANSKIVMGAIGIGSPQSRGRAIANDARRDKGVQYVAACDVDKKHLENAVQQLGPDCKGYEDFRELLDRKDINAVTIATPDHWHALVAVDALRKGKDVYCEKPLTLTVQEGQILTKVAKETGRIFQVGSQQRSDARFRLACELVRNGRLGAIKTVETRIGANPKGGPFTVEEPPKELNYDLWIGPTAKADYVKQRVHYEFRWWYEYSGGKLTDWGAHHNDIAQWGLGMDEAGPIGVEGTGEAPSKEPNSYNCHPTFKVTYQYPKDITLHCMSDGENGVKFEGEKGWIFVSRGRIGASDQKLLDEPLGADAQRLYLSTNHMQNFLDGVRTRKPCICTADVGHRSVTVCHLGAIALRTGLKLKWDPATQRFDNETANQMLSRPMRAPWKLA